jgi:hypothetical protein
MSFRDRMKRTVATVGTGTIVLVGASTGVVLMAGVASAHAPKATASCTGLDVSLTFYNAAETNTVTVTIDGQVADSNADFGSTYIKTFPWTTTASHTWDVNVFAGDDPNGTAGWTTDIHGTQAACQSLVTPAAPTFHDADCTAGPNPTADYYQIPTTTGVAYFVNGSATAATSGQHTVSPGATVSIVAQPISGQYLLTGTTSWQHTFPATLPDCNTKVTPAVPSFTDSECVAGSSVPSTPFYVIPNTTGVDYFVNGSATPATAGTHNVSPGDSVTITAAAQPGYELQGYTGPWSHSFTAAPDCTTHATPATPTVTPAVCTGTPGGATDATITIPNTTGVDYQLNGNPVVAGTYTEAPGTYTVTASPQAGYTLDSYPAGGWTLTLPATPDCNALSTPATPSVSQYVCTKTTTTATLTGPTYTIPATTGVDYQIAGDTIPAGTYDAHPGTLVITAVPKSGYEFPAGTVSTWSLHIDTAPTCVLGEKIVKTPKTPGPPVKVLPFTGNHLPVTPTLLTALLALGLGTGLTVAGRRRITLPEPA